MHEAQWLASTPGVRESGAGVAQSHRPSPLVFHGEGGGAGQWGMRVGLGRGHTVNNSRAGWNPAPMCHDGSSHSLIGAHLPPDPLPEARLGHASGVIKCSSVLLGLGDSNKS